jgi:hypothetical protein
VETEEREEKRGEMRKKEGRQVRMGRRNERGTSRGEEKECN